MIEEVCKKLDLDYVFITGNENQKQKEENVNHFETSSRPCVAIANPAAAGTGIDLVSAPYAIYYSRNFSLDNYLQSEARNHRGGSEIHDRITHIDLVAESTIDIEIQKMLANKQKISNTILHIVKDKL
jgi:SNF2 family DNA or RNA helicase